MSLGWRLLLIGYALVITCLLLMFCGKAYHSHQPLTGPFPWRAFQDLLISPGIGVMAVFASFLFSYRMTERITVNIDAFHFTVGTKLGAAKLKWKQVSEIVETGEYVCFLTNRPLRPSYQRLLSRIRNRRTLFRSKPNFTGVGQRAEKTRRILILPKSGHLRRAQPILRNPTRPCNVFRYTVPTKTTKVFHTL